VIDTRAARRGSISVGRRGDGSPSVAGRARWAGPAAASSRASRHVSEPLGTDGVERRWRGSGIEATSSARRARAPRCARPTRRGLAVHEDGRCDRLELGELPRRERYGSLGASTTSGCRRRPLRARCSHTQRRPDGGDTQGGEQRGTVGRCRAPSTAGARSGQTPAVGSAGRRPGPPGVVGRLGAGECGKSHEGGADIGDRSAPPVLRPSPGAE